MVCVFVWMRIDLHCVDMTYFNHSPTFKHLGCFQYFAFTDDTAMNNLVISVSSKELGYLRSHAKL